MISLASAPVSKNTENPLPICSVVIAAHNAGKYIFQAIESLQTQTLQEIEIIIIDDGSTDDTAAIVSDICEHDHRVHLQKLSKNHGQSFALNSGINMARGKYVAFLDADDIALANRLELQVSAMDGDVELILTGGSIITMSDDASKDGASWVYETSPFLIQVKSLFKSEFTGGSMCFRRDKLIEHQLFFDSSIKIGSDWELSIRAMKYGKSINLPETLIHYRIHTSQMTTNLSDDIASSSAGIRRSQIEALGIIPTDEEMMVHLAVSPCNYWAYGSHHYFIAFGKRLLDLVKAWFTRLRSANKNTGKYSESIFNQYLQDLELLISSHLSKQ